MGTNTFPSNTILKMMFLFHCWDTVCASSQQGMFQINQNHVFFTI